jgi:hypothetical protein
LEDKHGCFGVEVLAAVSPTSQHPKHCYLERFWRTWMIWSSFLMDSLLGVVEPMLSAPSDPPSGLLVSKTERARSLGLFVRVGFVWGEEAGDDTRGGWRDC